MSYRRALDVVHLRPTDGLAEQENLDHPAWMAEVTGRDPWEDPHRAYVETYRALDVDWIMGIPERYVARQAFAQASSIATGDGGRLTEWGLSGSYWREEYLFHDVEEVLRYDPLLNEPRVALVSDQVGAERRELVRRQQAEMGDACLVSSIYYTTLFQFPIMVFGWPLFLTAAAAEPRRFQRLLQGFAEISRRNLSDWAEAEPPLMLIHDDIAMQRGMVFRPAWYRQYLFPLYEYILEPLFARPQIRVCFVSDGDYTAVLPDLVALGFHGFLINPNMDLAQIARQYGRDHFLVGNVDTAILTFGDAEAVRHEVARCVEAGRACAGHMIKAMGDLPHNIPLENMRAYFGAVAAYR